MGVVGPHTCRLAPCRPSHKGACSRTGMERPAEAGNSPVGEAWMPWALRLPSRSGHVKPGSKQGGPPSKAEYSPMTDSVPVP